MAAAAAVAVGVRQNCLIGGGAAVSQRFQQ